MRAMNVTSKVPAQFAGASIPEYLSRRFTYLSEPDWHKLILEGSVSCNGAICSATTIVAKGDSVCCELPDFELPQANLDYTFCYQDEWLIGINKPAGLRVHSRGKFIKSNLIYHLRHAHQPTYPEANLVNRLDTDTSGLVLIAHDKSILIELMRQFAEGLVDKRYLAIVKGVPSPAEGTIDLPIGQIKEALVPRFGIDHGSGKAAVTHYRIVQLLAHGLTLLELKPETGRTHQLRVHMAAIGHPIAGDALYTMNDADYLAWCRIPIEEGTRSRQALHSYQLQFLHPVHRTSYTITAPMAEDLKALIEGA